jgi:hypothetical protein
MRILARYCAPFFLVTGLMPASATPVFLTSNQSALARSAALPTLGDGGALAAGADRYRVTLDWTNEYFVSQTSDEMMTLDGETERLGLAWRHGFSARWSIAAELPMLHTGGGVLDAPIENWHQLWGLPNGGREQSPRNRYQYAYQKDGQTLFDVADGTTGLGDVQLGTSWQARPALGAHLMVKLPTGSASHLTGGNPGAAFWGEYDPFADFLGPGTRWFGFSALGAAVNGRHGPLGDQQRPAAGFAAAGAGYSALPNLALLAQLYGHTPLYRDSGLEALRRGGLQLAFGARYALTPGFALTLGFQEDAIVASSPDFSIHLEARWQ